MEFNFNTATFETVQSLLFPIIKSLVGFDTSEWVGEQSELFIRVGDAFADIATLFTVVGTALEDGIATEAELNDIISKAKSIPEAIEQIVAFFDDEEPEVPTPPVGQ